MIFPCSDKTDKHNKTILILKTAALFFGLCLIISAIQIIIQGNWAAFYSRISDFAKILEFFLPYLLALIKKSLTFLWSPIIAYILICLLTLSKSWRFYLCISILSAAIIILHYFVFSKLDFSIATLKQAPDIFLYIMQLYILVLLTVPRELWNFIGGIIFAIQSLIITIMPDLPSYFDDLGMILAIFAFIFLYINTIASLIKRLMNESFVKSSQAIIITIIQKIPWFKGQHKDQL